MQQLARQVEQAFEQVKNSLKGITEQEMKTPPAPSEWTAAQVLGHVVELGPFWASKARLVAQQGGAIPGRTPAEQQARMAAVERFATEPVSVIQASLRQSQEQCTKAVLGLQDSDLDIPRKRPDGSEMTLRAFIERFIAAHLLEHAKQISEARKAAAKK